MVRTVRTKPDARRDLIEQADFIAQQSPDAAERFLDAAEATFAFLAERAELGSRCEFRDPRIEGIRVWRIRGFERYLVFYRPLPEGVEIVRIIHGSRDIESLFGQEPR